MVEEGERVMAAFIGPLARILLRYLAGAMVTYGLLANQDAEGMVMDPEIIEVFEIGLGLAIGAATEYWYRLARKFGWET
jgi:hypothetical protein